MHAYSHSPRKRFGQHFLHDPQVIARIVAAFAPRPGQRIIEIGPGTGALTGPLLEAVGRLEAIELDRDLIAHLGQRYPSLTLHPGDVLKLDFAALRGDDPRPLRLVGNLPYNISTPLLFHLLEFAPLIEDMVFMLQKEVVDRISAAPDTAAYGKLSVVLQYACRADPLFDVGPGAFTPPPKVDSSVLRLTPHPRTPVEVGDYAAFAELVAQAFSQRRKTLRNNLKHRLEPAVFAAAGIDPGRRAETLSLEEFAALARAAAIAKRDEQ